MHFAKWCQYHSLWCPGSLLPGMICIVYNRKILDKQILVSLNSLWSSKASFGSDNCFLPVLKILITKMGLKITHLQIHPYIPVTNELWVDFNKSHNAPVSCLTMHHFVTEMCTHVHISVTQWCIVRHETGALWDLCNISVDFCYNHINCVNTYFTLKLLQHRNG